MRTTIELSDDQRAKLLALAAKRRLRGYSALIQEALERYLKEAPNREQIRAGAKAARVARKIRGTLSEAEAERMRRRIEELWKRWR
jgi:predicted transcriptional regulator